MNYEAMRRYFPWADAAYGQNATNKSPLPVGNSKPVAVKGFDPTPGAGFDGALYKDPMTGRYTIAFGGSAGTIGVRLQLNHFSKDCENAISGTFTDKIFSSSIDTGATSS